MSGNQNRESSNLSKYNSMTSQQLQELLRLDSETPNNGGTDTEEILYIMEVLAQRKKDSFTDKKALESWESFQRDYLDAEDEEETSNVVPMPSRKASWARRWAAAAAVIVLLLGIPITASAVNWKEMWNAVVVWAGETFSFKVEDPSEANDPATTGISTKDNHEFQQALTSYGVDASIVPTRIPDRYFLDDIAVYEDTDKNIYIATYTSYENDQEKLIISAKTFIPSDPGRAEASEEILEIYEVNGITYYIMCNNSRLKAMWLAGPYECYIAGDLTVEEIKVMINFIEKG